MDIKVISINPRLAYPWIIERHYAKRLPSITYAFGAYRDSICVGIVTYGTPCSSTLRTGICGETLAEAVLELNRLCCESVKNLASFLVAWSLKLLPKPKIVVSFADTQMQHVGYVYQACNFLYTGLSAKRTDWKLKGREHLHGATIADQSRGVTERAEYMRLKYGSDFYLQERSRKHRYVYFCGNKRERALMRAALKYPVMAYPKGESLRYNASSRIESQLALM